MNSWIGRLWCLALLVVSASSCSAPEATPSNAPVEAEKVGTSSQALSSANGLAENGITTNGVWHNGIWRNGIWRNGIWRNGIWRNGIWRNGIWRNGIWRNGIWRNGIWRNGAWEDGLWSSEAWTDDTVGDELRSNPYARQLLQYIYECAMPGTLQTDPDTGETAPVYSTELDPNAGITCSSDADCGSYYACSADSTCVVPLKGGVGLGINAPDINGVETTWWESGECDESCQRWVSACVLARTNAYGVHVDISMRAPDDAPEKIKQALKLDEGLNVDPGDDADDERVLYPLREGGFYGNIFATTPTTPEPVDTDGDGEVETDAPVEDTPRYFACAGPGSNIPNVTKRFCSSQGDDGPIDVTGVCLGTALSPAQCGGIDAPPDADHIGPDGFSSVGALRDCRGDGTTYKEVITVYIHDLTEVCGNAVCENLEETSASCPSDCHPGTWARSWEAQLGGAAMDRLDGSVVVAGITSADIDMGGPAPLSGGPGDIVLAKYKADGTHIWSRRLANAWGTITKVAIADDGTIVLAGTNGSLGGWIVKLDKGTDTTGNATGTGGDVLTGWPVSVSGQVTVFDKLVVDHAGNVVGAGLFSGSVDVAGVPLSSPSAGFVFKIPSAGTAASSGAWANAYANTSVSGLAVDPWDNVLATTLSGPTARLAKLASATGLEEWHQDYDAAKVGLGSVAADSVGAVYVTGTGLPFDFGGGAPAASSIYKLFLVKYDKDGTYRWDVGEASNAGTREYSYGLQLAFDKANNVIVGGQFGPGTIDLGAGLFDSYATEDLFVASYATGDGVAPSDRLQWAKHVPMILAGWFFGNDVGGSNRLFAAGQFSGSMMSDDRLLVSDLPEEPNFYHTFLSSFVLPVTGAQPGADVLPPVLDNLPLSMVLEAQSSAGTEVWFMPPTAIDAAGTGTNVVCDPPPNSTFPIGVNAVSCIGFDPVGNQSLPAGFTVTIKDSTPPVFPLVPVPTVGPVTGAGAVATFDMPQAVDQIDGPVSVSCDHASGQLYAVGTTLVVCTALDSQGNAGQVTFEVLVKDTTPPVLPLPPALTIGPVGPLGATVTYSVTASDNVDPSVTPNCVPASGSLFHLGSTTVNCTATDAALNSTAGSFSVVVADKQKPVITVPAPITVSTADPTGAVVTYTATASDNVDASVTVQCGPPSGSKFAVTTTTVSCSATDAAGNTASASFPVTVNLLAVAPPVVTVPSSFTVEATGPTGATVSFAASALDPVDGPITPICTAASPSVFPLGSKLVTCKATNSGGKSDSKSFTVTVVDTTKPKLNLPATITKTATSSSGATVTYSVSATDAVSPSVKPNCTPASGGKLPLGLTTVSCTATDAAGNQATGSFQVYVQYAWSGFLQPINSDGSSIFKLTRTIPVKFQLTGASAGIKNAVAKISITKLTSTVTGSVVEAVSTSNADSGNLFRYDTCSGQYIFNLGTKNLTAGTWVLSVDLGDGVTRSVQVSLK